MGTFGDGLNTFFIVRKNKHLRSGVECYRLNIKYSSKVRLLRVRCWVGRDWILAVLFNSMDWIPDLVDGK